MNGDLMPGEIFAAQNPQLLNVSDILNVTKLCRNGVWDPEKKRCNCLPTWGRAHITDTVHFFEGVCDQYQCQSDATCQQTLNIPAATCPVKGWNCYCGWYYAIFNFWHGYATTQPQGGGACMGVMYTFSVSISLLLEAYFANAWKVFLALAILFIGVGRKRSSCDHHRPTILHGVRVCLGYPPTCPGDCVIYTDYGWESFRDDVGWTFYILHLGVWSYCFSVVVYLLAILVWSAVLWTIVVLCCIVLACIACCAACGEGMEGVTSCSSCDCCCGGSDCCAFGTGGAGTGGSADAFYFYGPFPYDPFWGYSGYGHVSTNNECFHPSCGCCIALCRPVAWLLFVFPVAPENMWGGVLGRVLGTHASTPTENLYQGGNAFIDFFSLNWRRTRDLHENDSWRRQVHDFLIGEHELQSLPPASLSRHGRNLENRSGLMEGQDLGNVVMTDGEERRVISISGSRAICIDRGFTMEDDNCVESSFEDYESNECWICRLPNEEWDMWMSCHHLFCKNCSTTMLQRSMPCPLCRVGSSTVLRGTKFAEDAPGYRA